MSENSCEIVRHTAHRSESIAEIATALSKAQGLMKPAVKDSENPFFRSKYADLASCWDACREALASNGLAVIQMPRSATGGVELETMLVHCSGQWISESFLIPVDKSDAQAVGKAITYARRYALCSFVGIAPEDDDGNSAAKSVADLKSRALAILRPAAAKGIDQLVSAWKTLSEDMRHAAKNDMAGLKEQAQKITEKANAPT